MNSKYLLLAALSLYSASMHAVDGVPQSFWSRNGDQICVNIISAVALSTVGYFAQKWLNDEPNSKENMHILQRDTTIANTSKQLAELHQVVSTTKDPLLAQECRNQIATGERLLAQAIALRNQDLAKLHAQGQSPAGKPRPNLNYTLAQAK